MSLGRCRKSDGARCASPGEVHPDLPRPRYDDDEPRRVDEKHPAVLDLHLLCDAVPGHPRRIGNERPPATGVSVFAWGRLKKQPAKIEAMVRAFK